MRIIIKTHSFYIYLFWHISSIADNRSDATNKLNNPCGIEVFYSTRHVEEAWHHLMKSEDTARFKQIAVCNFDFLLAAVSTIYLRHCCLSFFFMFISYLQLARFVAVCFSVTP